jgi:competence protein ComEC
VAENPGQFDFARYLRADRRRALLRAEHAEGVQVLESGRLGWLPRAIDAVRRRNKACFDRYLNANRIGLASAVLLGAREELDPEQSAAFMETGTVHLLVVSGLNVGILAGALWWLFRRTPIVSRTVAMSVVGLVTAAYMILTDAEPPIVRATVLVLGSMLALCTGRRGLPFNTLAAAALVVMAVNPVDVFNVGAQLSFLCVGGMVWLVPKWIDPASPRTPLERLIERSLTKRERLLRGGWRLLVMSGLIWLLTAPLVAARFHLLAPVAPLMNVVLWLPVLTGTLSGFGLLTLGWLWPLGEVLGWCCNASMWALQAGVDLARCLPGSHFWTAGPADWWLIGFYALVVLAATWPRRVSWGRLAAALGAWTSIGLGGAWLAAQPTALECTFLSVGHGSATVLRLPDGRTLLCDAGHLGPPRVAARAVEAFLWSAGLRRLDWIVLSHADTDHYNAVPELVDRFHVGEVCVSPVMFRGRGRALGALREALTRNGIAPRVVRAGDVLCEGPCTVRVLHPPSEGVSGPDNANSVVLVVEYLGQRILLPGDLDTPGLEELVAQRPVACAVMLSPHHGSKRSHPETLAAWAGARWIVTSGTTHTEGGKKPAIEDSAGRVLLHTAWSGAITVRIDEQGLAVKSYLDTHPNGPVDGAIAW